MILSFVMRSLLVLMRSLLILSFVVRSLLVLMMSLLVLMRSLFVLTRELVRKDRSATFGLEIFWEGGKIGLGKAECGRHDYSFERKHNKL